VIAKLAILYQPMFIWLVLGVGTSGKGIDPALVNLGIIPLLG